MIKIVLFILMLFPIHLNLWAQTNRPVLKIGFGDHNAEPYAYIKDGQLIAGIIKDIADEIGRRLAIDIEYVHGSRNRFIPYVDSGKIHLVLISSKDWIPNHDQYLWTDSLFEEKNIFLTHKSKVNRWHSIGELKNLKLGTILGYYYPTLDFLIRANEIQPQDARNLEISVKMLEANRVDLIINSNILIDNYLKHNPRLADFKQLSFIAGRYIIQGRMATQKYLPIDHKKIIEVLNQMVAEGFIQNVLQNYGVQP